MTVIVLTVLSMGWRKSLNFKPSSTKASFFNSRFFVNLTLNFLLKKLIQLLGSICPILFVWVLRSRCQHFLTSACLSFPRDDCGHASDATHIEANRKDKDVYVNYIYLLCRFIWMHNLIEMVSCETLQSTPPSRALCQLGALIIFIRGLRDETAQRIK